MLITLNHKPVATPSADGKQEPVFLVEITAPKDVLSGVYSNLVGFRVYGLGFRVQDVGFRVKYLDAHCQGMQAHIPGRGRMMCTVLVYEVVSKGFRLLQGSLNTCHWHHRLVLLNVAVFAGYSRWKDPKPKTSHPDLKCSSCALKKRWKRAAILGVFPSLESVDVPCQGRI